MRGIFAGLAAALLLGCSLAGLAQADLELIHSYETIVRPDFLAESFDAWEAVPPSLAIP